MVDPLLNDYGSGRRMGWNDVLEKKGWPEDYNKWSAQWQQGYEEGRLEAQDIPNVQKWQAAKGITPQFEPMPFCMSVRELTSAKVVMWHRFTILRKQMEQDEFEAEKEARLDDPWTKRVVDSSKYTYIAFPLVCIGLPVSLKMTSATLPPDNKNDPNAFKVITALRVMTEQRFYEEQEAKIQVTANRMIEKYQQQRLLFNPHFKRKLRDEMEGLDYAKLNEIMAGSFKKKLPLLDLPYTQRKSRSKKVTTT